MADPTGGSGPAEPYEGDAGFFGSIGAGIADEAETTPEPTTAAAEPGAEAAPATPAASEGAQARDEQGRFTKAEPLPPDAVSTSETAAAAPPVPLDLSQYPAYEYRAGGRSIPLQGAVRGPDGVFIPTESLPQVEQLLAQAHVAHGSQSARGREIAGLKAQVQAAQDEKNIVLSRMAEIMADPEKFDEWAANTQGNWERLVLEARLAIAEQERDSQAADFDDVVSEQQVAALIPQLHAAVEQTIQRLAADAEFQGLSLDAGWQKEFKERLMQSHFDRIFSEADAAAVEAGMAEQIGETMFDPEPIVSEMRYQASFARRELSRQKALAEAAERNRLSEGTAPAVPTAGAKPAGTPTGKSKPALRHGMSKDEVDRIVFRDMMEEG